MPPSPPHPRNVLKDLSTSTLSLLFLRGKNNLRKSIQFLRLSCNCLPFLPLSAFLKHLKSQSTLIFFPVLQAVLCSSQWLLYSFPSVPHTGLYFFLHLDKQTHCLVLPSERIWHSRPGGQIREQPVIKSQVIRDQLLTKQLNNYQSPVVFASPHQISVWSHVVNLDKMFASPHLPRSSNPPELGRVQVTPGTSMCPESKRKSSSSFRIMHQTNMRVQFYIKATKKFRKVESENLKFFLSFFFLAASACISSYRLVVKGLRFPFTS